MKRKFLSAIMVATLAMSMMACGAESASTESAGETAASTDSASSTESAAFETSSTWAPDSTVSIVVPANAGGDTDLTARVFAQYAKEMTGVDFVVVNASGAAGSVAANQVLSSAADGLTVLYGHNLVNVANVAGVTDYNYTAFKLGPTFAKNPANPLFVNPEMYGSLDEFVEAAKANPGALKACTEVGAYTYYELLAFEKAAGIDLDLVDVGSASDKTTAMLSKQVDLMPSAYLNGKDYLEAGQFGVIGVPTEDRYDLMADIPTFKEQGIDFVYPDCDYSFYFPADTSDDVITWYDDLVEQMEQNEEVLAAISDINVIPYYLSSEDSLKNDESYYNTFKEIADSLQ